MEHGINFKVQQSDGDFHVKTYIHSHRNLMALLYDELSLDGFGDCKGMGRCGSCQIRILNKSSLIGEFSDNEENTLRKLDVSDPCVRLSCKIFITERLNGVEMAIDTD